MKKKGFSMVELIVVIVIMGILSLISVPSFRGLFTKGRLEESRNSVFGFYQAVQRYATTSGVDYILEVDETNRTLRCMKDLPTTVVKDSLRLSDMLSLSHAGAGSLKFTLGADGFVEDNDNIRRFTIYDSDAKDSLVFYISPLGIMEVIRK